MKKISDYIQSYSDFPYEGIIFKDLLGLLREPVVYKSLIKKMTKSKRIKNCDAILAIDARGFIFGSAIALLSSKPLVVARKPNKLPGELWKKKYSLEYGEDILAVQKESVKNFKKFNIVDDVLATGGTAKCVQDLLVENGKEITGFSMVLELTSLKGSSRLDSVVESQLKM